MGETTTIQISQKTWRDLNSQKQKPNETFDDVIQRIIHQKQKPDPEPETEAPKTNTREATPKENTEPEHTPKLEFPRQIVEEDAWKAIEAAHDYIITQGEARQRDIVAEIMPNHDLGYNIPKLKSGTRYRGSWWRKIVKPGLETYDDIEKPSGGGEWTVKN